MAHVTEERAVYTSLPETSTKPEAAGGFIAGLIASGC